MSVKRTAPCGHPGEVVIGAYTRCLQGCSKDPHVQPPPATASRRGEPGHVDFCACKPCTVRRRGRAVVFRTQGGQVAATVPWDGIAKRVTWTAEVSGKLRHWKLLDEDGDVMLDGLCDVGAHKGDQLHMDIDTVVPMKLLAVNDMPWRTVVESRYVTESLRQAAMHQNFGKPTLRQAVIEYPQAEIKALEAELRKGAFEALMSTTKTPYCPCGILPGQCKCRQKSG